MLVQATKAFFQGALEKNFKYPNRVADAIEYMNTLNADQCATAPAVSVYPFATDFEYQEPEEEDA